MVGCPEAVKGQNFSPGFTKGSKASQPEQGLGLGA